jgi:hypothetical protein
VAQRFASAAASGSGDAARAGLQRVERRNLDLTNHFANVDEYTRR